MKQWLGAITGATILGVLIGLALYGSTVVLGDAKGDLASADSGDSVTIAVSAVRYTGPQPVENGEPCVLAGSGPSERVWIDGYPVSLVVSDHEGIILAAVPMAGTTEQSPRGASRCAAHLSVTVPDRPFYVLSVGDTTVLTVSRDALPFSADAAPTINFPT